MQIEHAYPCTYCQGDIDHACTACDPECDCIEIYNESHAGEEGFEDC